MRNGDLSAYLEPEAEGPRTVDRLPRKPDSREQLNPYSKELLNSLYPLPNYGPPGAIANNYLAHLSVSDQ